MKTGSKKRINTEKLTKRKDSYNSFLVETSFNSDIDLTTRKEIDTKFYQSKINSHYKFPRKGHHKAAKSRQITTKNSVEALNKPLAAHKSSKSSILTLPTDSKNPEKPAHKKVIFDLKISSIKKTSEKFRNLSSRQLKSERTHKSKSPKNSKKLTEIYLKSSQTTSKKQSIDCFNKIFTPYTSKSKLVHGTGSMRLKKIYHKSKTIAQ